MSPPSIPVPAPQRPGRRRPLALPARLGLVLLGLVLLGLSLSASPAARAAAGRPALPRPPADPAHDVPRRPTAGLERVRLAAVVDGDTLDVIRSGRRVRVRLECVDTEERLHAAGRSIPGAPQTVFGEETALWLAELLSDVSGLRLLLPEGREQRDAHGRLLAHLVLPDGRDLNVLLVRLGRSPYFQRYGPSRVDHAGFQRAQRSARRSRLGIWDARTNRPRTPGAPVARRDYTALLAWWEARALAVRAFRLARGRDAARALAADRPDELLRAAASGEPVRVFGEVEGAVELSAGALLVFLASGPDEPGLRLLVPRRARAALAPLELERRDRPGCQNFLWIEGLVHAQQGHFSIRIGSPTQVRPAGPEPR